MKYINQPIVKKDAYALLSGKPVYCDDLALKDCLIIKLLRSLMHMPKFVALIQQALCAFPVL